MEQIQERIEESLSSKILDLKANVGGSLSESRLLVTDTGQYFLKLDHQRSGALPAEANGLKHLAEQSLFRIPKVIASEDDFLITEFIEPGKPEGVFFETFAKKLAALHQKQGDSHGWTDTNFLGTSRQINDRYQDHSWAHFFVHSRIKPQIVWLKQKSMWPEHLQEREEELLCYIFDELTKLNGPTKSFLHGDLWSGNYLCDNKGDCVLIDPACYHGHHEAELSISRLFGGFPEEFFSSYYAAYPLEPGSEVRFKIYCLYHLLNHVNIFGRAYLVQTKQVIYEMIGKH